MPPGRTQDFPRSPWRVPGQLLANRPARPPGPAVAATAFPLASPPRCRCGSPSAGLEGIPASHGRAITLAVDREDVGDRPVARRRHAQPGSALDHVAAEPVNFEAVALLEVVMHRGARAGVQLVD